jgi:hypothetical protein
VLIQWNYPYRLPVSGISGQTTQQNHSIYAFKTSKYIGLFDIDEYVNMQKKNVNNIGMFLEEIIKENNIDTETIGSFQLLNKLFYNRHNPYWGFIREMIQKHNTSIKEELTKSLYCADVSYPVYEFDGKKSEHLNMELLNTETVEFLEWDDYYKKSNGTDRSAAKMFYSLKIREKKYRVEIRWKGDCFVSPQFHIHNIDE